LIDNQWIEIQELPENVKSGAQPTRMRVLAEADLAGVHHPGARITANVIPFIRSQKKGGQKTPMFDVHLSLISSEHQNTPLEEIDISDEDRDEILELSSREDLFELMTRSIAPNIYATGKIPFVKRSLALQLFGGVPRRYSDGTRTRGDIHILMMGDPGVAKSQLLSFMGRISPRGRFTTGGGTTAAGLTAAAVRDAFNDGRFSLEAGALVLADMGLCAVDEFDKMSDADRGAMHEAMEQQVINISKAGISASMRTRCAVLAAANPRRGRFDNEGANFEQIDLPPPLISRFDIIWLIRDEVRMEQDRNIAQYILQSRRKGVAEQKIEFGQEVDPRSLASDKVRDVDTNGNEVIPVPLYQKYVAYAKRNIFPELTDEAMEEIVNYYTETRSKYSQEDGSVPVTARALEALIRLAEAHARMELRNEATVDDAKLAISLYKHWRYELMGDDFDELTIRTGTSTQRRSAERVLMSVVRNLCRELGGECETIQIYNVAGEQGIDEDTVDRVLQNLNARGSIFCPRIGIWRIA
jgi:replicative DNA helicase Mcm